MFIIDKNLNRIEKIENLKFHELGFKEREHLQEWIANNTEFFGEELLIIQKEFAGFDDTKERLDLLALDKAGNIVVIENKLDDSGKDVTWQVLKYASYCATLTKNQIRNIFQEYLDYSKRNESAEKLLLDFFDKTEISELELNQTQRLILVSGNFRKEVTSTVLWLLNNYNLQIQCFKVTPYKVKEQLVLNVEQVIPVKDAEDYMIRIAQKQKEDTDNQNERNSIFAKRRIFWNRLLERINNTETNRFQNINPSKDPWINGGIGISGISLSFVYSGKYARTEVTIARPNESENKYFFDELFKKKEEIETTFGKQLEWERLNGKKMCRIKDELSEVSFYNEDDWDKMIDFMVDSMLKMEKAFISELNFISKKL